VRNFLWVQITKDKKKIQMYPRKIMQNNEDIIVKAFQMANILPLKDITLPPEDPFVGLEDNIWLFLVFC